MEQALLSFGCLLVLAGVCALGYMAVSVHGAYSLAAAGLMGAWWVICDLLARRRHRKLLDALHAAFAPAGRPAPRLKTGSLYAFPTLTLTFTSAADLQHAWQSGCIAAFTQAVQSIYRSIGSRENPFNADMAVRTVFEDR